MQSKKMTGRLYSFKPWLLAARPKTLPAALCPIVFAAAVAAREGINDVRLLFIIAVCAVVIQVICNYANDLYDFLKGADTEARIGPLRAVQAGLISPTAMKRALGVLVVIAVLLGLVLARAGGWPIVGIGVLSLLAAFAYTSGPLPLAYVGLGELFVLIFFGPVPVYGTLLILTGRASFPPLAVSVGISAIATALLVVNNIRDREQDAVAGKRTLAVRCGEPWCRYEYGACIALSFVALLVAYRSGAPLGILAGMPLVPIALRMIRRVNHADDALIWGSALAETVGLLVGYTCIISIGWLL